MTASIVIKCSMMAFDVNNSKLCLPHLGFMAADKSQSKDARNCKCLLNVRIFLHFIAQQRYQTQLSFKIKKWFTGKRIRLNFVLLQVTVIQFSHLQVTISWNSNFLFRYNMPYEELIWRLIKFKFYARVLIVTIQITKCSDNIVLRYT